MKLIPKFKWGGIIKAQEGYITINPGDTLSKLARKYNTTVAELQRLNNLGNSTKIYAGKKLKVAEMPTVSFLDAEGNYNPEFGKQYIEYYKRKSTPNDFVNDKIIHYVTKDAENYIIDDYKVKRGDTLSGIAKMCNVSIQLLMGLNNFDSERANKLKAGETIKIAKKAEEIPTITDIIDDYVDFKKKIEQDIDSLYKSNMP